MDERKLKVMERFLTLKQRIHAMAEKYAIENLGLDDKTYRQVLNKGLKQADSRQHQDQWSGKLITTVK